MAQFINWECGAEGDKSDDDFEDVGANWWQPRNGRARGTERGRVGNRIGRGGGNKLYSFCIILTFAFL